MSLFFVKILSIYIFADQTGMVRKELVSFPEFLKLNSSKCKGCGILHVFRHRLEYLRLMICARIEVLLSNKQRWTYIAVWTAE
jgi:hypothetical protein